jgi:sulfate adenylyltransferase subunit 1 (EFTu-like GTPase family)
MAEQPLSAGQSLLVKLGTATANARVAHIHYEIDIHSFATHPATTLAMNEIGVAELVFDKPLVTAPYATNRELGALVLIDRMTDQTVALGVIEPTLRSAPPTPPKPAWQRAVLRVVGQPGSNERVQFWQIAAARLLSASALYAIVVALSRDLVLAVVVALAEIALRPILSRLVRATWQHMISPPVQTYEAGDGI